MNSLLRNRQRILSVVLHISIEQIPKNGEKYNTEQENDCQTVGFPNGKPRDRIAAFSAIGNSNTYIIRLLQQP